MRGRVGAPAGTHGPDAFHKRRARRCAPSSRKRRRRTVPRMAAVPVRSAVGRGPAPGARRRHGHRPLPGLCGRRVPRRSGNLGRPGPHVREARVGSPPDNVQLGRPGLGPRAPLSPRALAERNYAPLSLGLCRPDGACRGHPHRPRDGLARLWWIPETARSGGGGYVRYPLGAMVDAVARVSQDMRCMVIGEDLGNRSRGLPRRDARRQHPGLQGSVLRALGRRAVQVDRPIPRALARLHLDP